jgi:ABC-type Fe3+ transport system permease subunit
VSSAHAADAAETTWTGATSIGQGRAISLAMLLAAILLAIILAIAWVRGRAGRRRRTRNRARHRRARDRYAGDRRACGACRPRCAGRYRPGK